MLSLYVTINITKFYRHEKCHITNCVNTHSYRNLMTHGENG